LTLTAPFREQESTVLACVLQRAACRSQGGALLSTDGTSGPQNARIAARMELNGSLALFQYRNRLRDELREPNRTEIEPADNTTLLADTFILEKDTRGEAVFRLAGTRLCATYGRELKGFSFPSLWREKDQRLVARLVHGVFQQKSVVVMAYEGLSRS